MTFSPEISSSDSQTLTVGKRQKTLKTCIAFSGMGVFTGEKISVRLCPAPVDHGIVFKRTDLPDQPAIPAKLNFVSPSPRTTMLVNGSASVQMVEHLLAALRAFEIDNLLIEVLGPEIPILDGSSSYYVEALNGLVEELDAFLPVYDLTTPIFMSHQETHMIALPCEQFRVSYTLDYPHFERIGTQFFSTQVTQASFIQELAKARTFCFYEELLPLIEKKIIRGVNLDHGLVFNESGVMNQEGLRFPNEPVRHKILDLVGDLSLLGYFNAHIIAIKSGHASHHRFGLELLNHIRKEDSK